MTRPFLRPVPTEKDFVDDLSYLPDRYGMAIFGDCLEPEVMSGEVLIFDKMEPCRVGDLVIMFRRREIVPSGQFQGQVKRLFMAPPPWVTFPWRDNPKSDVNAVFIVEMLNPHRRFAIKCADVIGIHRCVGVANPNVNRPKLELPDAARSGAAAGRIS